MSIDSTSQPLYYCFLKDSNTGKLTPIGVWHTPKAAASYMVGRRANRPVDLYAHHSKIKRYLISNWRYDHVQFDCRRHSLLWKKTSGGWLPNATIIQQEEWSARHMRWIQRMYK